MLSCHNLPAEQSMKISARNAKPGAKAYAIIKASNVMIGVD